MSSIIQSKVSSTYRSIQLIEAGNFEEARTHLLKNATKNEIDYFAWAITQWLIEHKMQIDQNEGMSVINIKLPDLSSVLQLIPFLYTLKFNYKEQSDSLLGHLIVLLIDAFEYLANVTFKEFIKCKKNYPETKVLFSLLPVIYTVEYDNAPMIFSLNASLFSLANFKHILNLLQKPTDQDKKEYVEIYTALQQYYYDCLFIHRYGIEAKCTTPLLKDGEIDLTGSDEDSMIEEVQTSWSKFEKTSEYKHAIDEMMNLYFVNTEFNAIETKLLGLNANQIYSRFLKYQEDKNLLEKILQGYPTVIPVLTYEPDEDMGHGFALGVMGNLCVFIDRSAKQSGMAMVTFDDSKHCQEFIKIILKSNQNPENRLTEKQFKQSLKLHSSKKPALIYFHAPQMAGTCAFASCAKGGLRIALLFQLLSITSNSKRSIKLSIQASRHIFSRWEIFDLKDFLENYLKPSPFTKPNPALIANLVIKYKNREKRKDLYEMIQTAKRSNNLLVEDLSEVRKRLKLEYEKLVNVKLEKVPGLSASQKKQEADYWSEAMVAIYEKTSNENFLELRKRFRKYIRENLTSSGKIVQSTTKIQNADKFNKEVNMVQNKTGSAAKDTKELIEKSDKVQAKDDKIQAKDQRREAEVHTELLHRLAIRERIKQQTGAPIISSPTQITLSPTKIAAKNAPSIIQNKDESKILKSSSSAPKMITPSLLIKEFIRHVKGKDEKVVKETIQQFKKKSETNNFSATILRQHLNTEIDTVRRTSDKGMQSLLAPLIEFRDQLDVTASKLKS